MTTADQSAPGTRSDITNLPNLLSMLRIASVPVVVYLLHFPGPTESFVCLIVFLIASLTDYFDGYFARRYGLVTPLGKLLDPLADKLLVISALIMLAMIDRTPGIPAWLVVVIVGREVAVTGLRSIAAAEGIVLGAESTGKTKFVLQIVGLHALILHYTYFGIPFHAAGILLLLASLPFALWSAWDYHMTVFRQLKRPTP